MINNIDKNCNDCRFYKSEKYHDLMWCRDCNSHKNHFEQKKYYYKEPDCGCFAVEFNCECLNKEYCKNKI